jgi:hypothetical protein
MPAAVRSGRSPPGREARAHFAPFISGESLLAVCLSASYYMPVARHSMRTARYTRKSFFVDAQAIDRARKALGAGTDAETVRMAVDRVVEMEKFWRFMASSRRSLKPGSIEAP